MTAYNPNLDADDTADTDGPGFRVPALLAALRQGAFPLVPEALRTAVAALEGADGLEREVMGAPPEGLAPFVKRVAAEVLGGRGLPEDFAEAAFTAQQSADRLNAKSIAVAERAADVPSEFHAKAIFRVHLPGDRPDVHGLGRGPHVAVEGGVWSQELVVDELPACGLRLVAAGVGAGGSDGELRLPGVAGCAAACGEVSAVKASAAHQAMIIGHLRHERLPQRDRW